jgi:polysaccharide deacetylase 2 family uncharacterized protein YibQ
MSRRRGARRGRGPTWGQVVAVAMVALLAGWLAGRLSPKWLAREREKAEAAPKTSRGARLALIVDDLGRRPADVDRLAALGVPLAGAVLPFEPRTAEVAAALAARGLEVLCHLPMEPEEPEASDPGPGALTLDMGRRRLAAATREALEAVPGAVGANHHMGSALSADAGAMRAVLAELDRRGLYYVDSRTVPESVGYRLALEMGVPAAERDVFLDANPEPGAVRAQWRRLLAVALERGAALAIAHPHEATLAVLAEEVPRARAAGFEFVPVADLLTRAGGPEL